MTNLHLHHSTCIHGLPEEKKSQVPNTSQDSNLPDQDAMMNRRLVSSSSSAAYLSPRVNNCYYIYYSMRFFFFGDDEGQGFCSLVRLRLQSKARPAIPCETSFMWWTQPRRIVVWVFSDSSSSLMPGAVGMWMRACLPFSGETINFLVIGIQACNCFFFHILL